MSLSLWSFQWLLQKIPSQNENVILKNVMGFMLLSNTLFPLSPGKVNKISSEVKSCKILPAF